MAVILETILRVLGFYLFYLCDLETREPQFFDVTIKPYITIVLVEQIIDSEDEKMKRKEKRKVKRKTRLYALVQTCTTGSTILILSFFESLVPVSM